MSKTDNGLKWPKRCFKCFKLETKSSLPMSSEVMKNWVYYFGPVRKVSNKIWASKHSRRPIIAKRSLSAKKVWYAIFVSGEGVAIKVLVEKGKKHHGEVLQPIFYMATSCSFLRNSYGVFEERKSNFFRLTSRIPQILPNVVSLCFLS